MKTIRKNAHKQIAAIFENALSCKVYRLDDGFSGDDCPISTAREHYELMGGRLSQTKPGQFTLHIHCSFWYKIVSSC